MASSSNEVTINQDTLQRELQDLRALKEKVIDERKQHDGELKGLNMQVQRKVRFGNTKFHVRVFTRLIEASL